MDRRKGSGSGSGSGSRDDNGGLAEATASRLRFDDADEEVGMEVEESPAAPVEEVIGNDKTSADYYFDSYSHFGSWNVGSLIGKLRELVDAAVRRGVDILCIQETKWKGLKAKEEMLKDVRTRSYQNVITQNNFLFKEKIVLDVGAGTGILSLFCAKAGAKHVYAIECSQMADMAMEIVKTNGYSDVITVIKGKVEEIELSVPKVDVIISEWMGYFLLFENMLDTVLFARDKWLADDGVVLPDKASLHLTAIEDAEYKEDKIEFWNNVYGFDMSCIKKQAMMEPLVDTVDANQIVTNCQLLKMMDISKMTSGDASFTVPFKLVAERNDFIHALVAYFNVSFTKCHKLMGFSTGPRSKSTHWKQTVLYLEDVVTICEGETLSGSMTVANNKKNPRDIDITLKYAINGNRCKVSRTQHYKMR